jgi:tetratricopeptide (TPR) repeat protein
MRFGIYEFDSRELVRNYYNILYPLLELGKFPKAERIYLRCEPNHRSDGFFLNWSGWIYQSWYELKSDDQVHLEKGLELYQKSSALIDHEYGKYSIRKYQNLENLGYTYNLIGQYDTGFSYLDTAIGILTKSYRTDIVYNLGNLYEMKANALAEVQRHEEALSYMDKADQCKLLQVGADTSEMAWNYQTRAKILAARDGARAFLQLEETVGFSSFIWRRVEGRPYATRPRTLADVPVTTPLAEALSRDLRQAGFRFVGPTIVYAFCQAVGVVNDHVLTCHAHDRCAQLGGRGW